MINSVQVPTNLTVQENNTMFTGLRPAALSGFADDGKSGAVHAMFMILNNITLRVESLDELIQKKRLVFISYENGLIKSFNIFSRLLDICDQRNVSEATISDDAINYRPVRENFDFSPMNEELYQKMAEKARTIRFQN